MPLFDAHGREIGPRPLRKPRRPKNVPAAKRVSSKSVAALQAHRPVEITLLAKHDINGVRYGPGRVVVTRAVAQVLLDGESRAAAADANFAGTRACIVGPGRSKGGLSVRQVAPEYFDLPYLAAVPFGVVDKTGLFSAS